MVTREAEKSQRTGPYICHAKSERQRLIEYVVLLYSEILVLDCDTDLVVAKITQFHWAH